MKATDNTESLKAAYMTIFSQSISPSPTNPLLAAGNSFGSVALFSVTKLSQSIGNGSEPEISPSSSRKPFFKFQCGKFPLYCMTSTDSYLVVGGVGQIQGYWWQDLEKKNLKPSWVITLEGERDQYEKAEVNSVAYNSADAQLFAGGGDNCVHVYDLESRTELRKLSGHSDYIHSISVRGNQCASASEDGSVLLWDTRQKDPTDKVEPYKHDNLTRPSLGKWVGSVSLSDDWLLCGGGPSPSLWHLRSLTPTTVFPVDGEVHITQFLWDRIVVGTSEPFLYQLSFNGDVCAQIQTSCSSVYSVATAESPYKIMTIGGSSSSIDVCTNFNYRDQVISFV